MRVAVLSLSAGLIFAQAEQHFERGIAMLREGNFEAACEELAAATRQPGATDRAFLNLGIAEAQLGRLDLAEAAFRRAIAMQPAESSAHYNLALVLLQKHEPSRAIRELETTVKLAPDHFDAQYNLGTTLLASGNAKTALPHLERAVALSRRPEASIQLARAHLAASQPSQAEVVLSHLDGVYRAAPDVRFLLAQSLAAQGDLVRASEELEAALRDDPRRPDFLVFKARLLQKKGQPELALKVLDVARQMDPASSAIAYSAAFSDYVLERYEDAAKEAAKAVREDPESDRAWFLQAIIQISSGNQESARQSLDRAIALGPGVIYYRSIYAMALLADGHAKEAAAELRRVVETRPDYALAHYQFGRALITLEENGPAAEQFEQALRLKPDLYEVYYQLGRAYRRLGRDDEARRALDLFRQSKAREATEREEVLRALQSQ